MLNYDISRMKQRVEFGIYDYVSDDSLEGGHETFKPLTTVWCGEYTNTQTQTFDNLGTHVNADLVLAIRHNPDVNKKLSAKYKGHEYKIIAINSDERINAFDLVTLQDKSGLSNNNQ